MAIILALGAGPGTTAQLASRSLLPVTTTREQLTRLADQGTVTRHGGQWRLEVSLAEAVSREIAGQERGSPPPGPDACDSGHITTQEAR